MQGTASLPNPTCTEQCVGQFSMGELEITLSSISQLMTCLKGQGKCPQAGNVWSCDREVSVFQRGKVSFCPFLHHGKDNSTRLWTVKKQTAVLMLLSTTKFFFFLKTISHYSPTKLQVVPLSQKKSFLRYIFGVQPLSWLTTVFHELKTRVFFFFSSSFFGPKQNGETMNSQALPSRIAPFQVFFELWHKHAPALSENPKLSSRIKENREC